MNKDVHELRVETGHPKATVGQFADRKSVFMLIVLWIVIGLVLGSIARIAMPGPAAGGMPVAILIGVIGALFGGIVGATIVETETVPLNISALMAAAGAMYPLFLYRCYALRFENRERSPSQPVDEKLLTEGNDNDASNDTNSSSPPTIVLESTIATMRICN